MQFNISHWQGVLSISCSLGSRYYRPGPMLCFAGGFQWVSVTEVERCINDLHEFQSNLGKLSLSNQAIELLVSIKCRQIPLEGLIKHEYSINPSFIDSDSHC